MEVSSTTEPRRMPHVKERKSFFRLNVARKDVLHIVAVTLGAALFLKTFIVDACVIPSVSMEDTLLPGDFVLVNKFIFGARTPRTIPWTGISLPSFSFPSFSRPAIGDVVIFEAPGPAERTLFVKRIVAAPGDNMVIRNGGVFVDDRPVTLPVHGRFPVEGRFGPVRVPRAGDTVLLSGPLDEYWRGFIAAEGHEVRMDDRGAVVVDGRVEKTYEVQKDYFFVLGDNPGNSMDSRSFGFVPADRIVGKAMLLYWSLDQHLPEKGSVNVFSSIRWKRIGMLIH